MIMKKSRFTLFFAAFLLLGGLYSCQLTADHRDETRIPKPKNIIFLVSDGMGYNHVLATNFYEHGEAYAQVYEQDDWVRLASSTYPAITRIDGLDTLFGTGYNPRLAWEDPDYLPRDYTGSAESATALSTGDKTFSASIGIGVNGDTLTHLSQAAKEMGKSIGVVVSVPFNHATPAGFVAHNRSRHNYDELAYYMLFNTRLDVIMGAGNPDYDDNGQPRERNPRYFGKEELWEQLLANDGRTEFEVEDQTYRVTDADGNGQRDPWTLVQDREDFIAMASGETPKRVLGIPKAYSTIHYNREMAEDETMPFTQPLNENVPTLEEMTKASLNILGQNPEGFFVMIEGGAVDWAGHDNHLGRMIEEQTDFHRSVDAVVEWVETHSSWEETLVIVTSDHETGYLTGPDHPNPVNQAVFNRGQGNLPEHKWNYDSHTNMLVPLFAKGPGADLLERMAGEMDPVHGPFIQHSDIANVLFLLWEKPEIEIHKLD